MKEMVLLYNFSDERLAKMKRALLPLKMCIKTVSKEDFNQPIGNLVGIKGLEKIEGKYNGENFTDEMLLMSGFTSARIDTLIRSLNKVGIGKINLKAVVTPTNVNWSSIELYEAIKSEHEEMNRK